MAPVDPLAPVDPAMLQQDPAVIIDVANAPVPDPAAADAALGNPTLGDPVLGDPALGDPTLGDPALAGTPAMQAPLPDGVIQPAVGPEVEDPAFVIPGAELPA
jgi:hypothetical protein